MTSKTSIATALGCAAALGLSGCSDLSETLGLKRQNPPDEFQVVTNLPLSIPPDFTLRPPDPNAPDPTIEAPAQQAREALIGATGAADGTGATGAPVVSGSAAEQALLNQAGASEADPSIRAILSAESRVLDEESGGLTDYLLFWQDPPPPGTVVNAAAEAARISANQARGAPINEGETPVIERRTETIVLF